MTKRIKIIGKKAPTIRSTSKPAASVGPEMFARMIGAERVASNPFVLSELRKQIVAGLKSRGGRPGLEGTEMRPKIPMSPDDWEQLEAISRELAQDGFAPTAGQVGSRLLHDAIASLRSNRATTEPLASRPSEPSAPYTIAPRRTADAARRQHLEQALRAGEKRAA